MGPRQGQIEEILRAQLEAAKKRYRNVSIDFDEVSPDAEPQKTEETEQQRALAAEQLRVALKRFTDFNLHGIVPADLEEQRRHAGST